MNESDIDNEQPTKTRRGYPVISSVKGALVYLNDRTYYIGNFLHGKGPSPRYGGGCYGYYEEGLIERMIAEGYIAGDPDSPYLTRKGLATLYDFPLDAPAQS